MGPSAEESRAHILDLPDEVMVKIFAHLTPHELHRSVAAVCRRWQRVAYYPYLWRNLSVHPEDLATFKEYDEDTNKDCREKKSSFLDVFKTTATRIDSISCGTSDKKQIENIIRSFKPIDKRLKHLQVSKAPVEPTVLQDAIAHNSLLSLSVNGVTFRRLNPFPDFSNLKSLYVECRGNSWVGFDPAAANFSTNMLQFAETCFRLEEFTYLGSTIDIGIINALLNTTRGKLKILGFTINIFSDSVWVTAIESSVSASLVKLTVDFECFGYSYLKKHKLLGLRNLHNLKYLEFACDGEVQWDHTSLKNLFHASTFINLEVLIIDNVSERGDALLYSITRNFHYLKRLRIRRWAGVTEYGIIHVLSECKNLHTLELIGLDTHLTIETFATIPGSLQNLSVQFCDSMDYNGITEIASRHPGLNIDYDVDPFLCLKDLFS